jgi:hypothetical protein
MARRETLAALGPATLQDKPAGLSAHPLTKAMGLGPATIVRLKCSLHNALSSDIFNNRKSRD